MSKPLIVHDDNYEPGGTFDLQCASHLIVGNDSWVSALREMAARSLILLRRTDGTLGPTDIAAAVAINALWKSGIQDEDGLHAASVALYGWQPEQKASDIHPISFALWNADKQGLGAEPQPVVAAQGYPTGDGAGVVFPGVRPGDAGQRQVAARLGFDGLPLATVATHLPPTEGGRYPSPGGSAALSHARRSQKLCFRSRD